MSAERYGDGLGLGDTMAQSGKDGVSSVICTFARMIFGVGVRFPDIAFTFTCLSSHLA
jgi:hypothetical protein